MCMNAPKGVTVGAVWIRKRGHREHAPEVVIANIYRPDRQVLAYVPVNDAHVVLNWTELRRVWRPQC